MIPARDARTAEVAAIAVTAAANLAAARLPQPALLPLNLATAAAVVALARRAGVSWREMGLGREDAGRGARWGAVAGTVAAGCVVAASRIGVVRAVLMDERATRWRGPRLAYEVAIRVPFATAVPEEVLFRGALLGLFERRRSRGIARGLSALLYGLWHVTDSVEQLRTHPHRGRLERGRTHRGAVVAFTIAGTAAAGYAFAWLRDRSRSVLAPAIAHASLNATGIVVGVLGARLAGTTGRTHEDEDGSAAGGPSLTLEEGPWNHPSNT